MPRGIKHRCSIPNTCAMTPPTSRQQQVLDFIRQHLDEGRPVPTVREISRHLGLKSTSPAQLHLNALRRKGYLEDSDGSARSLRLTGDSGKRVQGIPLLGTIPAGHGDLRTEEPEGMVQVALGALNIPRTSRTVALRVTGDSMIGKFITDGDIVILEQNADPRPGEVVAALIDGESTLKTFVRERGGRTFLKAENPKYPNLIPTGELTIQGVMRMLIRTPQPQKK